MPDSRTTAPSVAEQARSQSTTDSASIGATRSLDRWALGLIHGRLRHTPIRLALWDGSSLGAHTPLATVTIRDRRALFGLLRDPDIAFGDAYSEGRIEVDGDAGSSPAQALTGVLEQVYRAPGSGSVRRRPRPSTQRRARRNIHHHYDIGNAFYALWLDPQLVYTCAYFPTPETTLEAAQRAKMDHVCRKLQLRPGESVIEAGCGWGALALHMAAHYGVSVRAFNISREQIAYARQRAAAEGLADRVEFIEDDYRNIEGGCDAFVSVGMLEHVGLEHYAEFGRVIDRTLARGRGRGLLHFIGRNHPAPLHPWIVRRIFPGAYPPTLAEATSRILEPWDLSVLDVENLRLHYARTLQHWLARFETSFERVVAMFDEPFARAWRLYLAGSLAGFSSGSLQLFQIAFARGRNNDLPWTRAEWYR